MNFQVGFALFRGSRAQILGLRLRGPYDARPADRRDCTSYLDSLSTRSLQRASRFLVVPCHFSKACLTVAESILTGVTCYRSSLSMQVHGFGVRCLALTALL